MKVIGAKLRELGMMITLLSLVHMVSCEDRLDTPCPPVNEGKQVEVSLCVGLADEEDGAGLGSAPVDTKSAGDTGFDVRLVSTKTTKAVTLPDDPLSTAKPNMLYGLEVWQYDGSGNCLNSSLGVIGDKGIGESFTFTLSAKDECQLLIIARGYNGSNYTVGSLKDKKLSDIQGMEVNASTIEDITDVSKINAMPYILHLPKVKVVNDGGTYRLQSPDGTDVRILLRRMATRLRLAWDNQYTSKGYKMSQILLQSIPAVYKLIPTPDKNGYPSLLDQYRTIQLPESSVKDNGNYSCWIPTVVRGESPKATSDYYRTKENAPKGSAYATFMTQNAQNVKQKLGYRVYLGGASSHNFDLKENTNYIYKVEMSHTTLPVNDRRVTIIDPILASDNNDNLVPTANCFMVVPGGAFCFNPYKYYKNGAENDNALLQKWCSGKPIKSVKVLWQTLEDGDLGDPALGVVNNYAPDTEADDHTNIVTLKNGDNTATARIYCRVAPNTTGGSGVIAAYDGENGTGDILWSWHVWVTNYTPSATENATVLSPENQRVLRLSYSGTSKLMMDRCLGAYEGYVTAPTDQVSMSRANGFHYQRGRKDPFPGSYPSIELSNQYIYDISILGNRPPKHWLNRYKPDGITWVIPSGSNHTSVHNAYQHPDVIGEPQSQEWSTNPGSDTDGRATWSSDKTVHDPCPAGWRVPIRSELQLLINCNSAAWATIVANSKAQGGVLLKYDNTANTTYMRFSGYPANLNTLNNVGYTIFLAIAEVSARSSSVFIASRSGGAVDKDGGLTFSGKDNRDAQNIRCVQDRSN